MKLGCNTVLFSSVDVHEALAHIAFAGYEYVELAAIKGMCEHVSPDDDTATLNRVKESLTRYGLTATAIEAATTDPVRLEQVFYLATRLEVPLVNVGSGGVAGDEESTRKAIANLADLADLVGQYNLTLAVKPHVGQAIYNSATALRLVAEVPHPALGLNLDPSHLFRAGEDPVAVVRRWGRRIVTSHIRDCASREQKVGPPPTQIPGRGSVDLPALLRALADVGFTGPLNLEVIGAASYPLPQVVSIAAESRGYLHRCLREIAS